MTLLQVLCHTSIFLPLLSFETASTEAQAGLHLTVAEDEHRQTSPRPVYAMLRDQTSAL